LLFRPSRRTVKAAKPPDHIGNHAKKNRAFRAVIADRWKRAGSDIYFREDILEWK